jgi:4-amino-4-deoxy-L-arabinose transferase-like glycosyltransferase
MAESKHGTPEIEQAQNRPTQLLILLIIILGALFRFYALGSARHSYDDSYPSYDALRMLSTGTLLLTGQPSSVFLDNPALMSYLQAIPLLIWRSPWAIYLLIVALNSTATYFTYRVTCDLLGRTPALIAALLFAVNPWMVHFSRTTWVQALMPLLTTVTAWGLWPAMAGQDHPQRRLLLAFIALTVLTQTYIQAWGILAQVVLLVAIFHRRIPRKPLLIGVTILLIATSIYVVGLAGDWEEVVARLGSFSSGEGFRFSPEAIDHATRLVSGRDYEHVWARRGAEAYELRHSLSLAVDVLLKLSLAAGGVIAARKWIQRKEDRDTSVILLLWLCVPILLMSWSAFPIHIHYLLLSCPAGHILAAWGLSGLDRKRLRYSLILLLLAVSILFGVNLYVANQVVAQDPTTGKRLDDWALNAGARVGGSIQDLLGDSPQAVDSSQPLRIAAQGHPALLSSLSGTYVQVLRGWNYPNFIVLAESPMLYVLVNTEPEVGFLEPLHHPFPERTLQFADGTTVSFVQMDSCPRTTALTLPEVQIDWPSSAGLSMLGYTLSDPVIEPGQSIECVIYWRVEQQIPEQVEWFIGTVYQLVDQDGNLRSSTPGRSQWARRWELGDVYVEHTQVPLPADLPPGEYDLTVGLFDSIHSVAYPFIPTQGSTDSVQVPIIVE